MKFTFGFRFFAATKYLSELTGRCVFLHGKNFIPLLVLINRWLNKADNIHVRHERRSLQLRVFMNTAATTHLLVSSSSLKIMESFTRLNAKNGSTLLGFSYIFQKRWAKIITKMVQKTFCSALHISRMKIAFRYIIFHCQFFIW